MDNTKVVNDVKATESVSTKWDINKKQAITGFLILAAMFVLAIFQSTRNYKLSLFLITGLAIGYLMQRSRFGFAGGIRRLYVTGESSLTNALMFLLAI